MRIRTGSHKTANELKRHLPEIPLPRVVRIKLARIFLTIPGALTGQRSICISLSTKAFVEKMTPVANSSANSVRKASDEARAKIFRSRIYSGVPKLFAYMFDAQHATLIMANVLCSDLDNILLHPMALDVLYMFIFIISGKFLERLLRGNGCGSVRILFQHVYGILF